MTNVLYALLNASLAAFPSPTSIAVLTIKPLFSADLIRLVVSSVYYGNKFNPVELCSSRIYLTR